MFSDNINKRYRCRQYKELTGWIVLMVKILILASSINMQPLATDVLITEYKCIKWLWCSTKHHNVNTWHYNIHYITYIWHYNILCGLQKLWLVTSKQLSTDKNGIHMVSIMKQFARPNSNIFWNPSGQNNGEKIKQQKLSQSQLSKMWVSNDRQLAVLLTKNFCQSSVQSDQLICQSIISWTLPVRSRHDANILALTGKIIYRQVFYKINPGKNSTKTTMPTMCHVMYPRSGTSYF